jgi:hypothetical protein
MTEAVPITCYNVITKQQIFFSSSVEASQKLGIPKSTIHGALVCGCKKGRRRIVHKLYKFRETN